MDAINPAHGSVLRVNSPSLGIFSFKISSNFYLSCSSLATPSLHPPKHPMPSPKGSRRSRVTERGRVRDGVCGWKACHSRFTRSHRSFLSFTCSLHSSSFFLFPSGHVGERKKWRMNDEWTGVTRKKKEEWREWRWKGNVWGVIMSDKWHAFHLSNSWSTAYDGSFLGIHCSPVSNLPF